MKIQIREDLTQQELLTHLASSTFGILSPGTEPSVSYLVKPMTKPPSTKVEIRNKTITFPATEPGETSGMISQGYRIHMATDLLSLTLCVLSDLYCSDRDKIVPYFRRDSGCHWQSFP